MTDAIISGLLLGLALMFSVGPVIFTIIKLRINYGLASAFYFIGGVWLSDIFWVITANAFSGLFKNLITYKNPIGITGGVFLISLGIYYLFFKKYHHENQQEKRRQENDAIEIGKRQGLKGRHHKEGRSEDNRAPDNMQPPVGRHE